MPPASTLPTQPSASACSFTLVVSLNTTGAVHYVVVPNSPGLVSAASLNAAALSTQAATSVFPGTTIAATGDISVPQAFLNVTQIVTVGNAAGCGLQPKGCMLLAWHMDICYTSAAESPLALTARALLSIAAAVRHVWLILPFTLSNSIKAT